MKPDLRNASIDAATKESLRAVDRPLFKDFWERFLACLHQLRDKRQRTVYRLTLVKAWNMEEVEAYVKLLDLGEPDLIEIKAVTYCGTSDASTLTMEHVPWHHEVVAFAKAIAAHPAARDRYGVACEHKHSVSSSPSVRPSVCSVLPSWEHEEGVELTETTKLLLPLLLLFPLHRHTLLTTYPTPPHLEPPLPTVFVSSSTSAAFSWRGRTST